jgi:hypothetical protein
MSKMFLNSVWLQNSVRARALVEKKACVVGLTRLLCESDLCLVDPKIWSEVLVADVKVLEENADGAVAVKDEDESLLELEQTGYEAGFSKLYFASSAPVDYLPEYPAPTRYLAESIAKLSAARPGVVRIWKFVGQGVRCDTNQVMRLSLFDCEAPRVRAKQRGFASDVRCPAVVLHAEQRAVPVRALSSK